MVLRANPEDLKKYLYGNENKPQSNIYISTPALTTNPNVINVRTLALGVLIGIPIGALIVYGIKHLR